MSRDLASYLKTEIDSKYLSAPVKPSIELINFSDYYYGHGPEATTALFGFLLEGKGKPWLLYRASQIESKLKNGITLTSEESIRAVLINRRLEELKQYAIARSPETLKLLESVAAIFSKTTISNTHNDMQGGDGNKTVTATGDLQSNYPKPPEGVAPDRVVKNVTNNGN